VALREIDPTEISDSERYRILVNAIVPRPIALVSTVSAAGAPNLAPFSFFQAGGNNPLSIALSVTLDKSSTQKDTLRNVSDTREFCVNVVTRQMAQAMNAASKALPPDESEWEVVAFKGVPSSMIKPMRVAESPAQLECRLFEIVAHGTGRGAANYIIGEVVFMHVEEAVDSGSEVLPLIGRLGGKKYVDIGALEVFEMQRPSDGVERP
jgi:flavin reductase (DIM6/NTAB) family NADH-FMN oxidoreductase RutF